MASNLPRASTNMRRMLPGLMARCGFGRALARPLPRRLASACLAVCVLALPAHAQLDARATTDAALTAGTSLRQQGHLALSIASLRKARDTAPTELERMRATAELGAALLQARQLDEAELTLTRAHEFFRGTDRASIALDLANLAALQGSQGEAQRYYDEALALGAANPQIRFAVRLNQARLLGPDARLAAFAELAQELARLPDSPAKARWQINLGQQARTIGNSGAARAYAQLNDARRYAAAAGPSATTEVQRLHAEALDGLAQLYEDGKRHDEAMALTRAALAQTATLPPGAAGDLAVQLEWRQARLLRTLKQPAASLAAYQRAVRQVEAVRQDIPIDDESGVSSFRAMLEPLYLGLVESLLDAAATAQPAERAGQLREAVDTVELLRQSELQDYLGDRCEVDAVKGGTATVIPRGTAVLYPVVLADRLELLVETATGISRFRSEAGAQAVREAATTFAGQLRNGTADYLATSRQLYDWVLRPLEPALAAQGIDTLVVVPDGALRLVAMGAFNDGQKFAIEKYAIATATGMTMTNTTAPGNRARGVLLAGMSDPGPVVDKLSATTVAKLIGPQAAEGPDQRGLASTRSVRSLGASRVTRSAAETVLDSVVRTRALRDALALPGVDQEMAAISSIVPARRMLNQPFTVDGFRRAAESGNYSIIHVASHGIFGGSADASYILAYDDLLTLDGLQSLLRSDPFRRNPVELLSLSACETAEGDERSPLGISGAAMRARAKAVMGSLWPVADDAAVRLMQRFYVGLTQQDHISKAQALQRSQVALLQTPDFAHPFFWAPFILIGNWL